MNKSSFKIMVSAILWLVFSAAVVAEPESTPVAASEGKIEFKDLSGIYGLPKVEINLSKALIGMVGAFAQNEDPELGGILSKIDDITVRVYNVGTDTTVALKEIDTLTQMLQKDRWQPFVSVNEEKQKVRIFGKSTNGVMDGLVVMVVGAADGNAQPGENQAVFINIVGQIDPSQVAKVTRALNIQ